MANRELAKTMRTFGHDTNFIVQSATRDEAYQAELPQTSCSSYDSVNQVYKRTSRVPFKRDGDDAKPGGSRSKQPRFNNRANNSQQQVCPRCNRWMHRNRPCPALKLKCNSCGVLGHFAVVCRKKRVHAVEVTHSDNTKVEAKEEEVK